MNTNGKVILVTGATGHQGGASTRHLLATGWRVRALVRNPDDPAAHALADSGVQVVQGDMADLSAFADASFDLVFHPSSNGFVPEIRPVWREAVRVLRPGGGLLAGFVQPVLYVFDEAAEARGELVPRHSIPYSDLTSLTRDEVDAKLSSGEPLSFGHSLEDQIGGQLDAGFALTGFYEDRWDGPVDRLIACHAATRAVKSSRA